MISHHVSFLLQEILVDSNRFVAFLHMQGNNLTLIKENSCLSLPSLEKQQLP